MTGRRAVLPVLWTGALRSGAVALLSMLAVVAFAALVRLLPWLSAPEVPLRVSLPFLRLLLGAGIETACLVGLPLGAALAAQRLVERGEARALGCHGVGPASLAWRLAAGLMVIAIPSLFVARQLDAGSQSPGALAGALIQEGLESCRGRQDAEAVRVPVVGVSWLCFSGQPPLVTGPLPKTGGRVWFSARGLSPNQDLTQLSLTDLALAARPGELGLETNLRVRAARITGLPSWGAGGTPGGWRSLLVAVLVLILAALSAWGVFRLAIRGRLEALALGLGGPLCSLGVLHADWAATTVLHTWAWSIAAALSGSSATLLVAWQIVRRFSPAQPK